MNKFIKACPPGLTTLRISLITSIGLASGAMSLATRWSADGGNKPAEEQVQTFGGEAAVGEAHDGLAAWLQHSVHLLEHLDGLGQIVHRDSICDDVKAVVLVRQLGLCKATINW